MWHSTVWQNIAKHEIELELPQSNRGWKKFAANPEAYMANQIKRKQVEVSERKLTPEEAQKFAEAKQVEVRNFIASKCFQLTEEQHPEEQNIMGVRWLLTWKYDAKYADGKKAKVRAIVLGFQDPSYSERQTSSPTPTKAGKQLFLQMCAHRRFKIAKGDVSGAFLQGEDLTEELWCRPIREFCEELGVSADTPMLLRKAAYGLVQAPLHWYESICKKLSQLGYTRLTTEPCCWVYVDPQGCVRSAIHGHVDDFMFGGRANNSIHNQLMQQIQTAYKWGTWEYDKFEQCGIVITQHEDSSITLQQARFLEEVEEISISAKRSRQQELPTNDKEKS